MPNTATQISNATRPSAPGSTGSATEGRTDTLNGVTFRLTREPRSWLVAALESRQGINCLIAALPSQGLAALEGKGQFWVLKNGKVVEFSAALTEEYENVEVWVVTPQVMTHDPEGSPDRPDLWGELTFRMATRLSRDELLHLAGDRDHKAGCEAISTFASTKIYEAVKEMSDYFKQEGVSSVTVLNIDRGEALSREEVSALQPPLSDYLSTAYPKKPTPRG